MVGGLRGAHGPVAGALVAAAVPPPPPPAAAAAAGDRVAWM